MGEKKIVEALVNGGQATAGPPLGPALGPLGVNVLSIVNKINEITKDYSGMKVPVKISIDTDNKEFEVTRYNYNLSIACQRVGSNKRIRGP